MKIVSVFEVGVIDVFANLFRLGAKQGKKA